MKQITFFILTFFLLYSCKSEKKEVGETTPQKSTVILDSTQITNEIKPGSSLNDSTKEVKNILSEKENETSNIVKSISQLWKTYKSSKAKATSFISSGKLDSIIYYLNRAANAAYDLSREDIATWQLNNIGYYSITEFKKRTEYDKRIQKLATMTNLKKKGIFLEETKSLFKKEFNILSNAQSYLYKAQLMDSELEKSERTDTIERNIQFIEWIDNFISGNKKKVKRDFSE